jgi:hypothetical protein
LRKLGGPVAGANDYREIVHALVMN